MESAESSEVLTGFRLLAECSPAGLFIVDREGCSIYMNPRVIDICKSTVLSSTRQSWAQSLGLEDPASIMASWSATASIEYSETFRICTPDSTWRWIEVRTLPDCFGRRYGRRPLWCCARHIRTLAGTAADHGTRYDYTDTGSCASRPRAPAARFCAKLERSSAGIRACFGAWTSRRGPCGQLQSGRAVIQLRWHLRPTLAGLVFARHRLARPCLGNEGTGLDFRHNTRRKLSSSAGGHGRRTPRRTSIPDYGWR